jgi:trk system potassium uptake protein TrkA
MVNNFAVLGLGTFGARMTEKLCSFGHNVLAIDVDPDKVNSFKNRVTESLIADVSNANVLKGIDIKRFDSIILSLGDDFEDLVMAITHLKQEGANNVVAKANTELQKNILMRIGADEVIMPERDVALRLAKRLSLSNISNIFELKGYILADVNVPKTMNGKSIVELDLRNRHNLIILLVKKPNSEPEFIVDPKMKLFVGDELAVIGKEKNIIKVFNA